VETEEGTWPWLNSKPSLLNHLKKPFKLGSKGLKMESPLSNFAVFQVKE
jgi:hypothetical protein